MDVRRCNACHGAMVQFLVLGFGSCWIVLCLAMGLSLCLQFNIPLLRNGPCVQQRSSTDKCFQMHASLQLFVFVTHLRLWIRACVCAPVGK